MAPPWGADDLWEAPRSTFPPREVQRQRSQRQRQQRAPSPPRVEDTTIGKGFGEFLKRGVAQAVPAKDPDRAEIVPSKDGGFIATIQKGIEGIFGHVAASKEEVLKKRGPMLAPEYEAVPGDDIDQRVQFYARQLPIHLGESLKIYRIVHGRYKIGKDEVRLAWQSRVMGGGVVREVFVFTPPASGASDAGKRIGAASDATSIPAGGGSSAAELGKEPVRCGRVVGAAAKSHSAQVPSEPLPLFLRHTANIAYDLQFGGNSLSQVPEGSRLSFADVKGTLLVNGDADAKFNAMNIATAQARKREAAAKEHLKKISEDHMEPYQRNEDSDGGLGFSECDIQDARISPRPALAGEKPHPASVSLGNNGGSTSREKPAATVAVHQRDENKLPQDIAQPTQPEQPAASRDELQVHRQQSQAARQQSNPMPSAPPLSCSSPPPGLGLGLLPPLLGSGMIGSKLGAPPTLLPPVGLSGSASGPIRQHSGPPSLFGPHPPQLQLPAPRPYQGSVAGPGLGAFPGSYAASPSMGSGSLPSSHVAPPSACCPGSHVAPPSASSGLGSHVAPPGAGFGPGSLVTPFGTSPGSYVAQPGSGPSSYVAPPGAGPGSYVAPPGHGVLGQPVTTSGPPPGVQSGLRQPHLLNNTPGFQQPLTPLVVR